MRLFKCFLITIAFLFLAPSLAAATDDPLDDAIAADIGSGLGKMIADAINSAAEYQNQIADFNRDIAAARAEFWRQYPNGPHIRAATKRFLDLLLAKDIGLMNQTVSSGKLAGGSRAQLNAMDFLNAIGGKIDDGIRPMAGSQFYNWVDLIRKRLRAHGSIQSIFDVSGRYATAIAEAWPAYKTYAFARDYAEFAAAGRFPPSVTGPRSYIELMIVLGLTDSIHWGDLPPSPDLDRLAEARAEAHSTYERLTQIFGEAEVRSVATKVMKAKVNRYGGLEDPASLGIVGCNLELKPDVPAPPGLIPHFGTDPYGAFFALLTNLGPREYLLGIVAQHVDCNRCTLGRRLDQASGLEIQRLELAYGSKSLTDAAEEVRHAPKRLMDGNLLEWGERPYRAFMRIVSSKNPRGFVRWLILTDVKNISGEEGTRHCLPKISSPATRNPRYWRLLAA